MPTTPGRPAYGLDRSSLRDRYAQTAPTIGTIREHRPDPPILSSRCRLVPPIRTRLPKPGAVRESRDAARHRERGTLPRRGRVQLHDRRGTRNRLRDNGRGKTALELTPSSWRGGSRRFSGDAIFFSSVYYFPSPLRQVSAEPRQRRRNSCSLCTSPSSRCRPIRPRKG